MCKVFVFWSQIAFYKYFTIFFFHISEGRATGGPRIFVNWSELSFEGLQYV